MHEYVRVVLMRVRVRVRLCVCVRALRIGPRTIGNRGAFYMRKWRMLAAPTLFEYHRSSLHWSNIITPC